jgi:hypothetical protein
LNAFLVVLRGSADDYPLSLHSGRQEALEAAEQVATDPDAARDAMELDWPYSSQLLCVSVVHFVGGRPVETEDLPV